MAQGLRVLIVEDSEDDALLLVRELNRGGFETISKRVDTVEAMERALDGESWDLVVSDYSMPHFRGTDALKLVKGRGLDVPFVFVSGTILEETAVEAMKAGAQDYIMKGNLKRLVPAVRRELAEAEVRRKRDQAEQQLRLRDARIQALHEINTAITSTLDLSSVLDILLEKIDILLPYSAATITLYNKETQLLEPTACRNVAQSDWRLKGWQEERDPENLVFRKQAPLISKNLQADARVQAGEFYRNQRLVSYMGIPLIAKGEISGVLGLYTRNEHEFSDDEIEFLTTLGSQVAVAIHNSRLYEEIKFQAGELKKANEVKSDFLSIMSHELRTPINLMMGYVEMVQDGSLGEVKVEQGEALKQSLRYSKNLLNMITDLLRATQLQAPDVSVLTAKVDVEKMLDDLKSAFALSLPPKGGLALIWNIPPNLPTVETDADKLKQILQSLIDNAIKFTEAGAVEITARSFPEYNRLELEVADTGTGIPENQIPVIFDLFRQIDSSSTRSHEGVGLGLYLVKKNIELLGGEVKVTSELGKGSIFTVSVPIRFESKRSNSIR